MVGTARPTAMQAFQTHQLDSFREQTRLFSAHTRNTVSRRTQRQVQLQRRSMAPEAVTRQQPQSAESSEQPDSPRRVAIFVVGLNCTFGQPSTPKLGRLISNRAMHSLQRLYRASCEPSIRRLVCPRVLVLM